MDGLIIITESDWKSFCEEWGGIEEKGISAEIKSSNTEGNNLAGSYEDMPMSEEDLGTPNLVNGEVDSRSLLIRTCPEVQIYFYFILWFYCEAKWRKFILYHDSCFF